MSNRRLALVYILTAAIVFLLGAAFALTIPATYTTDALLIAKEQNNSGSLSGLASATKLLGLGAGADQSSNFAKFQKYWGSRDVAEQILRKHPDLLRRMFARDWDTKGNRWYNRPHTLQQYLAVPLNAAFGVYPGYRPTAQNLADIIKNSMKLEVDEINGEVFVQYKSGDAAFARWFLSTVISATDEAVRTAEQRRDQDFIVFSRARLEKETNIAYRDALTDSVRQFEIANMYSEAGVNFSFQFVEAPYLPTVHSAPRPLLYTVLAFIFANLIAICLVSVLVLWPNGSLARRVNVVMAWSEGRLPARNGASVEQRIT